ncbi:MAG: hypothetical protein ACRC62_14720 [Microcoleus sp.]
METRALSSREHRQFGPHSLGKLIEWKLALGNFNLTLDIKACLAFAADRA